MQSIRIAFRNVSRQYKRSFLLGGAIAFGFFVFTVVNGFTAGLEAAVRDNVAGLTGGHIYVAGSEVSVQGREVSVIRDTATLDEALAALGDQIEEQHVRSSANASLIFRSTEASQRLVGVDTDRDRSFLDGLTFVEGDAQSFLATESGLLLPEDTVGELGLEIGETVIVKASTIHGQVNVGDFVVSGSIRGTESLAFSFGYAHIGALNALLGMEPGQYQSRSVYLRDLSRIEATTLRLHAELDARAPTAPRQERASGPTLRNRLMLGDVSSVDDEGRWEGTKFEVTNANDMVQGVDDLVDTMNAIALAIFLVIVLIIMVGVMNSYRLVMVERTGEIGTMRAMGVQRAGIRRIFVWEAFFLALGGALVGLALALVTMGGLTLFDLGWTDFGFFLSAGHLRFSVGALETFGTILLICAMSVAAVLVPAEAAARLDPAEALRARY